MDVSLHFNVAGKGFRSTKEKFPFQQKSGKSAPESGHGMFPTISFVTIPIKNYHIRDLQPFVRNSLKKPRHNAS